jgi:Ca2+-binding EF-hand superfamily protein
MNAFRQTYVKQAFDKLDKDGNGVLEIADIKGVYNAKKHPDVMNGKKTEDDILGEFLETFEAHHTLLHGGRRNRQVTRDEFMEYYNNVSASIDNDQYFELMMKNAWKLGEQAAEKKGWTNKTDSSGGAAGALGGSPYKAPKRELLEEGLSDDKLMEHLRDRLSKRGTRGMLALQRAFKIADDDNSKDLDPQEFSKAVHDFRIDVSKTDCGRLFKIFDRDHSGKIDYDEFLRGVRVSEFRLNFSGWNEQRQKEAREASFQYS